MGRSAISRRNFIKASMGAAVAVAPGFAALIAWADPTPHVVSIVRIVNDNVEAAVEQAIDLLGGMASLTQGKNRILLKPNLVAPGVDYTTTPAVIRALARLMHECHYS